MFFAGCRNYKLKEKIATIVIYDKGRVNGETNYDSPRPRYSLHRKQKAYEFEIVVASSITTLVHSIHPLKKKFDYY